MKTQTLSGKIIGSIAVIALIISIYSISRNPIVQNITNPVGSAGGNYDTIQNFAAGESLGLGGFGTTEGGETENGAGSNGISTTTSFCIVKPPLATSTIENVRMRITQATTTTTVIAFGTSTNPYATSTITSLATEKSLTGQTQYLSYNGANNMFQLPTEYGVFYYTNLTTNGQLAEGQAGNCEEQWGQF